MLASDQERQATVLRLQAAHLEGRLDVDDLETRVGRAAAARTREELDAVEADLPERAPVVLRLTNGTPRWPGRRHFTERKLLDAPPPEVREAALNFIVPSLERHGFRLLRESADTLAFSDGGAPLTVRFRDTGDGRTLVLAHGLAGLSVRRAFAGLSD